MISDLVTTWPRLCDRSFKTAKERGLRATMTAVSAPKIIAPRIETKIADPDLRRGNSVEVSHRKTAPND